MPTIIRTPELLREMAIELKLSLDYITLGDRKDGTQRAIFEFISLDFDYQVSFDFEVDYYEDDYEEYDSVIVDTKGLVFVCMLDLSHGNSRTLDHDQLKSITKEKLTLLVKKFMSLE